MIGCPAAFFRLEKSPRRHSGSGTVSVWTDAAPCRLIEEKEGSISPDRTADVASELMALEAPFLDARAIAEEVVGIQRAVAVKFKGRGMVLVGSTPGDQVDDAAAETAEFRVDRVGLDADLLVRH